MPCGRPAVIGSARSQAESRAEWENEGGATARRRAVELPSEIEVETITYYRIGPFKYTKLKDAMAQVRRSQLPKSA